MLTTLCGHTLYSHACHRSGPYEGRGPKERLAELALVAALAGAYMGLGFGDAVQVANGALVVLIGIPLRWVGEWVGPGWIHPICA